MRRTFIKKMGLGGLLGLVSMEAEGAKDYSPPPICSVPVGKPPEGIHHSHNGPITEEKILHWLRNMYEEHRFTPTRLGVSKARLKEVANLTRGPEEGSYVMYCLGYKPITVYHQPYAGESWFWFEA